MTKIIPIRDLKDTSAISNMVRESDEPVYVTKNGYSEMVMMSPELYDELIAKNEIYTKLLEGERDISEGNVQDADEVMDELKKKYDL